MADRARRLVLCACCVAPFLFPLLARAALTGGGLAMKSAGLGSGSDWVLDHNGYVGTYITLDAPGQVSLAATVAGETS